FDWTGSGWVVSELSEEAPSTGVGVTWAWVLLPALSRIWSQTGSTDVSGRPTVPGPSGGLVVAQWRHDSLDGCRAAAETGGCPAAAQRRRTEGGGARRSLKGLASPEQQRTRSGG